MDLKKWLFFLSFFAVGLLQAENLVFSGTPATGKEFLCSFSFKENISRKMARCSLREKIKSDIYFLPLDKIFLK